MQATYLPSAIGVKTFTQYARLTGLLCILFSFLPGLQFAQQESPAALAGYQLWMDYRPVENPELLEQYRNLLLNVDAPQGDGTLRVVREELQTGLNRLLDLEISFTPYLPGRNSLVVALLSDLPEALATGLDAEAIGPEGYYIRTVSAAGGHHLVITAQEPIGLLYGSFHLLRLVQTYAPINNLNVLENPRVQLRMLNHWDNLDRTIERGYAGFSIWNWHTLPGYIDPRYIDYARANASVGINGTAITSVNANALILTPHYLEKVRTLAEVFRPYGLKVYLTARFSAPMEIGWKQPTPWTLQSSNGGRTRLRKSTS